jgi:hypothetical protein
VGISERRQIWVLEWIRTVPEDGVATADFDSGLCRLSFVCGALVYDKPFLAPLFSLAAMVRKRTGGKVYTTCLPPYIKFILSHLGERISRRREVHCARGRPRNGRVIERFRTDAKAEGDLVTVGGYQTHDEDGLPILHTDAKWFLLVLTRASAPWAFAKGEPFRTIASLELLGSLLGIMLLVGGKDKGTHFYKGCLSVGVGGLTDNSGNRYAVARMLSTRWPLVAFLAELSAQLEDREMLFEMNWVPREQNAEADAITNGDVDWLNPKLKVTSDLEQLPFIILKEILIKGAGFYEQLEAVNMEALESQVKDPRSLRVRDPWD